MPVESLYIGNATRQRLDFQYRVTKDAPIRQQFVPPGTQIKVSGELVQSQVDYIVRSQAKYGIVAADSIDQAQGFHGTCYSIGKPITSVRLIMLMEHNLSALVKRGEEIRKESAVAQSNMIEQSLREEGRSERLTEMELTIQQENHQAGDTVPQLSEGFRVIRNGDAPRSNRQTRRARRAA